MGICMTAIIPFVMSKSFANLPLNANTGYLLFIKKYLRYS